MHPQSGSASAAIFQCPIHPIRCNPPGQGAPAPAPRFCFLSFSSISLWPTPRAQFCRCTTSAGISRLYHAPLQLRCPSSTSTALIVRLSWRMGPIQSDYAVHAARVPASVAALHCQATVCMHCCQLLERRHLAPRIQCNVRSDSGTACVGVSAPHHWRISAWAGAPSSTCPPLSRRRRQRQRRQQRQMATTLSNPHFGSAAPHINLPTRSEDTRAAFLPAPTIAQQSFGPREGLAGAVEAPQTPTAPLPPGLQRGPAVPLATVPHTPTC